MSKVQMFACQKLILYHYDVKDRSEIWVYNIDKKG